MRLHMKNLAFFLLICSSAVIAQSPEVRTKHYNTKRNLGIQGYDPVSYFQSGPEQGDDEITAEYNTIS